MDRPAHQSFTQCEGKRTGSADLDGESRHDRDRLGVMPDAIAAANGNGMENTLIRSAPCPHCGAQMLWTQNAAHEGSSGAVSAAYRCANGHGLDPSTTRQCPACGIHDTTLLSNVDGRQNFRCARCGQAFTFPREFVDKPLPHLEEAVIAPLRAELAEIPDGSTRQNGSTGGRGDIRDDITTAGRNGQQPRRLVSHARRN